MDRNQIFSIVFSLIMIGSIAGTAVYFSNTNPDQQHEQTSTQNPTLTKNLKGFKATGIKARVTTKLPAIAIQGTSLTTNITDLETALTKTSSFVNLFDSRFLSQGGQPIYFALYRVTDVSLLDKAEEEARRELQGKIKDLTFFHYASVSLLEPINFQQIDGDNQKNIDLNTMEAFIFNTTPEEADIELTCSAVIDLDSDKINNVLCSEIETGQQQGGFQIINFETQTTILDLNDTFTFTHSVSYKDDFDENTLKKALETVPGVSNVEYLAYTPPQPLLTLSIGSSEANDLEKRTKLDSAIKALPHASNVETTVNPQGLKTDIQFEKDTDLNALKTEINTALEDANVTTSQLNDNALTSELNAYIHFDKTADITTLLSGLEDVLKENNVEPTLARIAYGNLPPQLDYSGKKYFVQNPENAGMVVLPTREIGDEITITLLGIASGDTLTSYALVKDKAITRKN